MGTCQIRVLFLKAKIRGFFFLKAKVRVLAGLGSNLEALEENLLHLGYYRVWFLVAVRLRTLFPCWCWLRAAHCSWRPHTFLLMRPLPSSDQQQ